MRQRLHPVGLFFLVVASASLSAAENRISDAYAAILRGDYDQGRTLLSELVSPTSKGDSNRLIGWLDQFDSVRSQRDRNRQSTLDWHLAEARTAAEEGKTYLAASFLAQAMAYAGDKEIAELDWVGELRRVGLKEAESYAAQEKWRRAHSYYLQLQRIFKGDQEIRGLRLGAARHARLEALYEDGEAVERRLQGVKSTLLRNVIDSIAQHYFEEPNFQEMGKAAIEGLQAMASTTRLYQGPKASRRFDGVADPHTREFFMSRLADLHRRVESNTAFNARDLINLFRDISRANNESVKLPEELLVVEFTENALGKLDDYTSVVWPADSAEFDKAMVGEFFGVGIQLGEDELTGRLKVATPLENSPALRAGIQPDDLIIAVDGVSTADWTSDKAVREITGPEGTEVILTLFRPRTGEELVRPLKRSRIQLTTIRGVNRLDENGERWNFMLDPDAGIAYVRLTGFNPDSGGELKRALSDAQRQGMRGLILDLRYNPGGLLDVAVETVSTFLDEGAVVSTRGRAEPEQKLHALGHARYPDLPLVVLLNESSASASEILAGALQAHGRGVVLGERSFGKGSVQRVMMLERNRLFQRDAAAARLKLTTALYYLPDGRTPHRADAEAEEYGVLPDWVVALTPKEFIRVIERERSAFIIHNERNELSERDEAAVNKRLEELKTEAERGGSDDDSDREPLLTAEDIQRLRSDPHDAPDIDPQLEVALLQLRVKLLADVPWPKLAKYTQKQNVAR